MFKVGDRVKPVDTDSFFSHGTVTLVYKINDWLQGSMSVKFDVQPPQEYSVTPNGMPVLVCTKWFELE